MSLIKYSVEGFIQVQEDQGTLKNILHKLTDLQCEKREVVQFFNGVAVPVWNVMGKTCFFFICCWKSVNKGRLWSHWVS